ncbi:MAG: rhomboid family intramembrane serine protease [Myxococcales bacterium]|nr:rhomboid family intramembrane serine protease [Myxococcales bacterium]
MASGSSICPHCGGLNSIDEKTCFRCGQRLPGPLTRSAVGLLTTALGREFPLTKLYVILCVAVFVMTALASKKLQMLGGVRVSEALRWGAVFGTLGREEPWRYLSAMFVHFGALHLGFNMMALWDFGRATEQRLGSGRFTLIFVLTGVLGFVVSDLWYAFSGAPALTAGASGGLFGLTGALIGYLYAAKDPAWKQFLVRVVIYAVIFAVAMSVNNAAHIGGFATGFPLGYAFYKERSPWGRNKLFGGIAVVLVLASVASIVLCQTSDVWREVRRQELLMGRD